MYDTPCSSFGGPEDPCPRSSAINWYCNVCPLQTYMKAKIIVDLVYLCMAQGVVPYLNQYYVIMVSPIFVTVIHCDECNWLHHSVRDHIEHTLIFHFHIQECRSNLRQFYVLANITFDKTQSYWMMNVALYLSHCNIIMSKMFTPLFLLE